MVRIVGIIALGLVLSGCSILKPTIVTEYRFVDKPVLACPSPVALNNGVPIVRPALEIHEIPQDASDGEVARAYTLSVRRLQGYAQELEILLNSYDNTSKEYENLQRLMNTLYPAGSVVERRTE